MTYADKKDFPVIMKNKFEKSKFVLFLNKLHQPLLPGSRALGSVLVEASLNCLSTETSQEVVLVSVSTTTVVLGDDAVPASTSSANI